VQPDRRVEVIDAQLEPDAHATGSRTGGADVGGDARGQLEHLRVVPPEHESKRRSQTEPGELLISVLDRAGTEPSWAPAVIAPLMFASRRMRAGSRPAQTLRMIPIAFSSASTDSAGARTGPPRAPIAS
jgi:hypothetical protein